VGLSFYGYSPKLVDFAAEVSRDVGDPSFWASISPSVVDMCKDRLLRTLRSCKPKAFQYTLLCRLLDAECCYCYQQGPRRDRTPSVTR
jgi:hypothetical protein